GGGQLCEVIWNIGGTSTALGESMEICGNELGVGPNTIFVDAYGCGGDFDTTSINIDVIASYPLEIVSTSPASCPDNEDESSCDKTCSNSTITYTVPESQDLDLEWEVVGAESYEVDNNLITVTWGNPGVGEISVTAGGGSGAFQIHCAPLVSSTPNGGFGSAQVFANGGAPPYSYLWCNGSTSNIVYQMPSGPCSVTVTDNSGEEQTCNVVIPEGGQVSGNCPSEPAISSVEIFNNSCGESNGTILLSMVGGPVNYTYEWSPVVSTSNAATNLESGIYDVTITNNDGCSLVSSFPVFSGMELTANTYVSSQAPNSGIGTITTAVYGGVSPYDYIWSSGEEGPQLFNAPPGTYCVTITDFNGCSVIDCVTIQSDPTCPLNVYLTIDNLPTGCSSADGNITANVTGNSGSTYTFDWDNFTTGNSATSNNLTGGFYCVTVTDSNGCTTSDCVNLPCDQNIAPTCSGEGSLCIDIIPSPEARIGSDPPAAANNIVELCKGETILFSNLSSYADSYVWELGDGYSTSAEELSYEYQEAGLYEVILIARNECFCIDTTSLMILVSDSEIPEIDCNGTTCANTEQTYTTSADCSSFVWTLSANGTVTDGGSASDNFVTVEWGSGPIGEVSVEVTGCNGDYCDKPTTEQIPIIQDGTPIDGPDRICPGEVTTYSLPLWTGTSYDWTVAPGGEIKSGEFTNTITVKWDIPTNFGGDLWVNCVYDNCFLDCGGESHKDIDLTPEYYLTGAIEACENSTSSYSAFDAIQNNSVYCNWSVKDPSGTEIWNASNVHSVDVPWPLAPGRYELTANPVNPTDFCNNTYTIYVNVNPGPPALTAIDGLNAICPGEFYTYSAVANQGNVSYYWEINNGGTISETAGESINVQWGMTPPYILTVKQLSNSGLACESLPYSMEVVAISEIGLTGPNDICVESTETYSANDVGNATYDWLVNPDDAGTILSGQGTNVVEILWHIVGTADVSLSLCGNTENVAVNVSGFPEPEVNHPAQLCPGDTEQVSTTESFSSYVWFDENGTQLSTSPTPELGPGYYEVVVTNATGCEGQSTFEIDAWPEPEIVITNSGFVFYCETAGFPIPTLHALNTEDGYTIEWYRNGVPLNVFTENYTPTQDGSYYVLVTDVNGCTNFSNSIYLNETCNPDGTCTNPPGEQDCPNVSNTFETGDECRHGIFENTSVGYVPGSVVWNFGDFASGSNNASTLDNPEHMFTSAGLFNIVMEVTDPSGVVCFINSPFEVPVAANFDVDFACLGEPTAFKDISTFTSGTTITDWDWDFGDPTSGANNTSTLELPDHTYNTLGTYDVILTVTAQTGCTSTITKQVTVLPPPTGTFAVPDNSCEATALSFVADLGADVVSSSWDFGDPVSGDANTAVSENTFHAFSATGIFDVTLTFENIYGCSNSVTLPVNVDANNLSGDITMDPSSPICADNSTTAISPTGGSSWSWGTSQQTETITISEAGIYDLTITDDFGCTYSPPDAVLDVIPNPEAVIKVTEFNEFGQPSDCFFDGYVLCEGEDVFLDVSGAGDQSYTWSSGESGPTLIYDGGHNNTLTAGTYDFTVTVTDNVSGCTNVEGPYTIIVNPVPTDIEIATNPPGPICEGTEANFFVTNPDPDLTYLWNTGEYGPQITASTAGEYFARGISQFGCEGESNTLEIYRSPDANLIPDGCHVHCAPDTICLPEMPNVANYQWYLDDNPIAAPDGTVADLLPQESGMYRVELYNIHGCYAASDAFSLDLLPFSDDSLILGTCAGDNVMYAGEMLLPGSTTDFSFTNQFGCDSLITVSIVESIDYEMNEVITTCEGSTVEYNGVSYQAGDNPVLNYTTAYGCDSIVSLEIIPWETYEYTETFSSCDGTAVIFEGESYMPGTSTDLNLTTFRGCDSTITIVVTGDEDYYEAVNLSGCEGEMVMYNGTAYPAGTEETFTHNTVAGCDSII
ncbi:MAG: PKD domain-containing protein, partial [Saprospiraceae bacterium]